MRSNAGLPPGVYEHGNGFRCRYRPDPGLRAVKWSRVFPTAELCLEFLEAARARWSAGLGTPKLWGHTTKRTWTFHDFALEVWWPSYIRGEQTERTRQNMRSMLEQHVLTSVWTLLPLGEIRAKRLQDWFDVRVDNTVPEHLREGSGYDFAADLAAVRAATGVDGRTSVSRLRTVLWLVKNVLLQAVNDPEVALTFSPASSLVLKRLPVDERVALKESREEKELAGIITREHVQIYADAVPAYDQMPFWFMYAGGLRISEAFGVRIRDWDRDNRRLWVVRQLEPKRKPAGQVVRLTSRMKTVTSSRYVYVCERLAKAIDAYIAEFHGPDPDPEAPICVGAEGLDTLYGLRSQFRHRLAEIGKHSGLTTPTLEGRTVACAPRPHGLRRAIASELHRNPSIPAVAISRFLGHKMPADFAGARITAASYLKPFDEDLRKCADVIGELLDELGVTLRAADLTKFVTPRQAAAILGIDQRRVYYYMRAGRLTGHDDVRARYVSGSRARVYLELAEVESLRALQSPTPDVAVRREEAQKLLGIGKDTLISELRRGDKTVLRPWVPKLGQVLDHRKYVTVESIDRYLQLKARKAAGELVTGAVARRMLPVALCRRLPGEIPHVYLGGIPHYEREVLVRLSDQSRPDGHIRVGEAAHSIGMSAEAFIAAAGLTGEQARAWAWIPADIAARVDADLVGALADARATRAAARAANPVIDVIERPDADIWLPIGQAAVRLSVSAQRLEWSLAGSGRPRQRYDRVVYMRSADVEAMQGEVVPEGYLTTAQVSVRIGRSQGWVSSACRTGQFEARSIPAGGRKHRYLVAETSVRAWQHRHDVNQTDVLNVYDVARELGVRPVLVKAVIAAGELSCNGSRGTHQGGSAVRILRRELEAFKAEHMPGQSALTVSEVHHKLKAEGFAVPVKRIHSLLSQGKVPGATRYLITGSTWWLPASSVAYLAAMEAVGLLKQGDVLRAAGFEPDGALYRELRRFVARQQLTGIVSVPGRQGPAFEPGCVKAVRTLLLERGYSPTLDEVGGAADGGEAAA